MLDFNFLVTWFNALDPFFVLVLFFLFVVTSLFYLGKNYGLLGLFFYAGFSPIVANIQVLKACCFFNLPDPVALGTIIHSSLFLATSLIAEKFGDSFAKKAISFSILSPVLFTVIMLLTLGAKPIMPQNILAYEAHTAMKTLFVPLPAIIVASLLTFYASQHVMLCFLNWIKNKLTFIPLVPRNMLSMGLGQAIDAFMFNTLAWVVFAPQPYSFSFVLKTYIIGALLIKIVISTLYALVLPFLKKHVDATALQVK